MHDSESIKFLIDQNINVIDGIVEFDFGDVIRKSFDDIIDMIDEEAACVWLPKVDCEYKLIGCTEGFYYATLKFYYRIEIDPDVFLEEYFN